MLGIYIRVSTDKQKDHGHSIAQQKRMALDYIKENEDNTIDYKIYDDAGYSAATLERPGMKELIIDIASGSITKIIFSSIDRITRSMNNMSYFLEHCALYKVTLICITSPISNNTPEERLQIQMQAMFAEFERAKISQRTKSGIIGGLQKGLYTFGGHAPFGYRRIKNTLVIDVFEAEIVRHIFDAYVNRDISINSLMDHYKLAPTNTKKRKIPIYQIPKLLSNKIYIGIIEKDESTYTVAPPIIPINLFESAQTKIKQASRVKNTNTYLFSKKIFCSKCHTNLVGVSTYKKAKRYLYYMCNNKGCSFHKKRINQELVFSYLKNDLNSLLIKHSNFSDSEHFKNTMIIKQIQRIKNNIKESKHKISIGVNYLTDGTISKNDFKQLKLENSRNIQYFKKEINELSSKLIPKVKNVDILDLEKLENFVKKHCENYYCDLDKKQLYKNSNL